MNEGKSVTMGHEEYCCKYSNSTEISYDHSVHQHVDTLVTYMHTIMDERVNTCMHDRVCWSNLRKPGDIQSSVCGEISLKVEKV